jgi:hypothetical protein
MRVQGKEEEREMSLGTSRCPIPSPPTLGGEEFRSAPIQPVKRGGFFSDQGCSIPFCGATRIVGRTFYLGFVTNLQVFLQGEKDVLFRWCYKSQSAFAMRDQPFASVMLQISSVFAGRDQCFI